MTNDDVALLRSKMHRTRRRRERHAQWQQFAGWVLLGLALGAAPWAAVSLLLGWW